jgi:uncharacterized phage protein gp47/JayE
MANVQARLGYWLYKTGERILERAMPDSTQGEHLTRWLAQVGATDGQDGEGRILLKGSSGTDVVYLTVSATAVAPEGMQFRDQSGTVYQIDEEISGLVLGAGNYLADASSVDKGTQTNIETGTTIELIDPPTDVRLYSTVTQADMDGATDEETDAAGLARLKQLLSNPSLSGNTSQIRRVIEEVGGAQFEGYVWPQRYTTVSGAGAGTVDIAALQKNESGADRIITAAQETTITGAINTLLPVQIWRAYRFLTVEEKDTDGTVLDITYTIAPGVNSIKNTDWDANSLQTTVSSTSYADKEIQTYASISGTLETDDRVFIAGYESTVTGWISNYRFTVDQWQWAENDTDLVDNYVMSGGGLQSDIWLSVFDYADSLAPTRGIYADANDSRDDTLRVKWVQKSVMDVNSDDKEILDVVVNDIGGGGSADYAPSADTSDTVELVTVSEDSVRIWEDKS